MENVWTKASCNISSIIVAVELVRLSTRGGLIVCLLVSLRVVLCNLSMSYPFALFIRNVVNTDSLLVHIVEFRTSPPLLMLILERSTCAHAAVVSEL